MKISYGILGVFFSLAFLCAQAATFKHFEADNYPGKTAGWESQNFIITTNSRCWIDEAILATVKCIDPILEIVSTKKDVAIESAEISGFPIFVRDENFTEDKLIFSNVGSEALNHIVLGGNFNVVIKFRSPKKSDNPKYSDKRVPFEGIMYLDETSIALSTNDTEVKQVIFANKLAVQERASNKNNQRLMMYGVLALFVVAMFYVFKYIRRKGRSIANSAIKTTIEINDKIVAHNENVRIKERLKDESESK